MPHLKFILFDRSPSNVEPELRAMWAENRGFDEVLISKRMIKDHMPDTVLESLAKVSECSQGLK